MPRLAHYFVTACIAVVSICVTLVLYAAQDIAVFPALLAGAGVFAIATLTRDVHLGQRQRVALGEMLDDDKAAIGALAARADQVEARLKAVEARLGRMVTDPSAAEIATLGGLVKELADSLAEQELRLGALTRAAAARGDGAAGTLASGVTAAPTVSAPPMMAMAEPAPPAAVGMPAPRDIIEAVEREQIEVHLQVVVSLPQRKPRLYDAQPRLKLRDGRLLAPAEYRMTAGALGRLEGLDALHFQRCVQIVRRLAAKNRELVVVCNLSLRSLSATILAEEAIKALATTPGLSGQLVFAFSQAAIQSMSRPEADCLARLATAGYRFALDGVADLRFDAKSLASRGFRFVRVAAAALLAENPAGTDVHIADLPGLLVRSGIELIGEGVASEAAVVNLLDCDLRLAQGPLFGALRPVRAEFFGEETAVPSNPTLGETALQGMIEKMRKTQEEKQATQEPKPGSSRSGWRALAKQVGSRERA